MAEKFPFTAAGISETEIITINELKFTINELNFIAYMFL